MSTATIVTTTLTAEEFARRPDPGHPEELVKGRPVAMPPAGIRHGEVCNRVGRILGNFVEEHGLGRVLNNDAGVITERTPDSVRGPDVSFFSFARMPKGTPPTGYAVVAPDLVVEVLSPHDRWPKMLGKVAEYLNAGAGIVAVLDPERRTVHIYEGDLPVQILGEADEWSLPALLPGFRVAVARLFA